MQEIKAIDYGEDEWGRKVVVTMKTHARTLKLVDNKWHTCTKDGEPDCPLKKEIKIKVVE